MPHILKALNINKDTEFEDYADHVVEVKKVKKDVTIQTEYGPALITAGNYIATDAQGKQFGITETDLKTLYEKI